MAFCTTCGAALPDAASFCPACGAPRGLAPATPAPTGPRLTGQTMEPWLVALLAFITLGIYGFVWWWRVSREADAFTGRPGHAHGRIRLGTWLDLGAIALAALAVGLLIAGFVSSGLADPNADPNATPPDGVLASLGFGIMLLFAAAGLGLAGFIVLCFGYWRVWEAIRDDEARRRVPNPLSPGLMLVFVLVPYLNLVTMWVMYYRTQKGLNGMWDAQRQQVQLAAPPNAWG